MKKHLALVLFTFLLYAFNGFAEEGQLSEEALATISEKTTSEKNTETATPELIIAKVNEAVTLVKEKGKAAFPEFKGKESRFLFAGTYIWIHDTNGIMRMHPIKYKMEGKHLIGLKDVQGKRFFTVMNKVAKEQGSGWVSYYWPKPGTQEPVLKVSYVKLCEHEERDYIIGCGLYGLSESEVKKLTGEV